MDRKKIKRIVRSLECAFESRHIRLTRVVVFGSGAAGRDHEESDLDILVISEQFAGKTLFERARITGEVHWEFMQQFHIPLDIIAMTPAEFDSEKSLIAQTAKVEGQAYKTPTL